MKILAIERDDPQARDEDYTPHLKAEAARAYELQQAGVIRELYFQRDEHIAVLILECTDEKEAEAVLSTLPLVQAGLIRFDVMPLVPYPGFGRLFGV